MSGEFALAELHDASLEAVRREGSQVALVFSDLVCFFALDIANTFEVRLCRATVLVAGVRHFEAPALNASVVSDASVRLNGQQVDLVQLGSQRGATAVSICLVDGTELTVTGTSLTLSIERPGAFLETWKGPLVSKP